MKQPLSREEKIQLARGILQVIGIIVLLICITMLLKYREVANKPCVWVNEDGTQEETGLYGNCQWLNKKLYPLRYMPNENELINTQWNQT